MLNLDFQTVEKAILQSMIRIRKSYERSHNDPVYWTEEVERDFNASIKPLKATLKTLRESYAAQ